jgi:putative tryptophan/tyrosine transport system substrate-binding protein
MRRREFIAGLGGAAAWPLSAHAQRQPVRHVGVLMSTAGDDPNQSVNVNAFVVALGRLGWTPHQNLELTYRWAAGSQECMTAHARELVSLAPDVLLVQGANVLAARQTTTTIPIVFVVLGDDIAEQYVESFGRPGGNITGFTSYEHELVGKRLALLRQMSPHVTRVLYIRSARADATVRLRHLVEEARVIGIAISDAPAEDEAQIMHAVASFARAPYGGLLVAFNAITTVHSARIVELAAQYRLPAIYPFSFFIQRGGLFSYGMDQDDHFRQAASYVARILAGGKPADLPVQAPTRFDLVINLKTATALGIAVPPTLLARADKLIE